MRQKNLKVIFLFGNGGNAANTSHIAGVMQYDCRSAHEPDFRILSLNENTTTLTSYGNDSGYETIFEGQLRSYANPGDVAIAMSTSGNTPNVVNAINAAKEMGLNTIGFTGAGGGKLKELVDVCVQTPSNWFGIVEDVSTILGHIFTIIFMENNDNIVEKMVN